MRNGMKMVRKNRISSNLYIMVNLRHFFHYILLSAMDAIIYLAGDQGTRISSQSS